MRGTKSTPKCLTNSILIIIRSTTTSLRRLVKLNLRYQRSLLPLQLHSASPQPANRTRNAKTPRASCLQNPPSKKRSPTQPSVSQVSDDHTTLVQIRFQNHASYGARPACHRMPFPARKRCLGGYEPAVANHRPSCVDQCRP